jgi:hypothetical protein
MNKQLKKMAALMGLVVPMLCAAPSFAATATWNSIVGVITAPDDLSTDAAENINSPVGKIASGTFPWFANSGFARVNLATGLALFRVRGLVVVGQAFSGTPGPVNTVTGTLVCNPGDQAEMAIDTRDVPIDGQGNAHFSGTIDGIPALCANPVFLVRIATIANPQNPNAARGRWIATGTVRSIQN